MDKIKLERVGDKLKIITPYNDEFIEKARELHGKWNKEQGAWWLDDSTINEIRAVMLKVWNTTGEETYTDCTLVIKKYTACEIRKSVYLFNRKIAQAHRNYGRPTLGRNIVFVSGTCRSGGTAKNWETQLVEANFEIHHFPTSATKLKEVQKAISEGWCEVKRCTQERTRESVQSEIREHELLIAELRQELDSL